MYLPPGLKKVTIRTFGGVRLTLLPSDIERIHAMGWYFFPLCLSGSLESYVTVEYTQRLEPPMLRDVVPLLSELPEKQPQEVQRSLSRYIMQSGIGHAAGGTLIVDANNVIHHHVSQKHLAWATCENRYGPEAPLTVEANTLGIEPKCGIYRGSEPDAPPDALPVFVAWYLRKTCTFENNLDLHWRCDCPSVWMSSVWPYDMRQELKYWRVV